MGGPGKEGGGGGVKAVWRALMQSRQANLSCKIQSSEGRNNA